MYSDNSYTINKFRIIPYVKSLRFRELALSFSKLVALMPFITMFFMPIFNRLHLDFLNTNAEFYLALFGALLAGSAFFKKIAVIDWFIYLLVAVLLYVSPLLYPRSALFIQENYTSFVWMTMSFYFVGRTIDFEQDKLTLLSIARLGFVVQLAYQFLATKGYFGMAEAGVEAGGEQMGVAYGFLFCMMYTFICGIEFKSKFDLYLSFFGIVLLLFMGTRGPVVVMMTFIIGYFLLFHSYKAHAGLKKCLIIAVSFIVYQFLVPLLLFLSMIAEYVGLSTRVFDSILANQMINLSESNGRDEIFTEILTAVQRDDRGLGYGLGGDRLFTDHAYSHNFEVEFLTSFGLYLGGALLLLIFYMFFRCVMKTRGTYTLLFWFSLFCFGFMSLQFSGTWINKPEFFLFIGYCVSVLKNKQITF